LAESGRQAAPGAPVAVAADDLERRLLGLWSELLGEPVTDPAVNFFDLGATSIHLAVMHTRLRDEFRRDFPITELFAHPTTRALAAFLAPEQRVVAEPDPVADRGRLQQQAFARFRKPHSR
jgi:acyl carrier protein